MFPFSFFTAQDRADPWPLFSRDEFADTATDAVLAFPAPHAIRVHAHVYCDAGRPRPVIALDVGGLTFVLGPAAAGAVARRLAFEAGLLSDLVTPADTDADRRRFALYLELGRIGLALDRATVEAHTLAGEARAAGARR